jgi:hypothetical protein
MPVRKGNEKPGKPPKGRDIDAEIRELAEKHNRQEVGKGHRTFGAHRAPPNYLSRPGNRQDQLRGFKAPEMKAIPKKGVDRRNPKGKSDLALGAERLKKLID